MLMTGRPSGSGVGRWKRNCASSSGGSTTSSFSRALMRDWTRAARLALYLGRGGREGGREELTDFSFLFSFIYFFGGPN